MTRIPVFGARDVERHDLPFGQAELDEILALGDRIAVMYDGKIIDVFDRDSASRERCGLLMAGSKPEADKVAVTDSDADSETVT